MSGLSIPLSIALPLLASGLLALLRRRQTLRRGVLLGTLGLLLAHHLALLVLVADGAVLATRIGDWPGGVAIAFIVDTFSALMLVATSLVALVCVGFALAAGEDERHMFAPLVLILAAGVTGVLVTGDLFNMFVFLEVTLMPSYVLISMSSDRARFTAGRVFLTLSLLTSTIFLLAVGLVYGTAGTIDLASLAGAATDSPLLAAAGAVLLAALAVKSALVPVHGWLAETYPHAAPGVTALFSGLHTKIGIYAIYRLYTLLYDGAASFAWLAVAVCVLSMVVGALAAFGQGSMRPVLAFHMVSQNGYITLGAVLLAPVGAAAGIFYLLHHMMVKASLFLSVGAVEHRYGTGRLDSLGGLARREPLVALVFLIPALSLAGMPPFSGFIAKYVLVRAAVSQEQYVAAVAAVAVGLLTLASMAKIWQSAFIGDPKDDDDRTGPLLTSIPVRLAVPPLALAAVTVALGLWGEWLLALCDQAARGLSDYASYVEAVNG
ncbi:monovalent cation/H+ antiporter subunit D family protein [Glycomyces tarimensis]